MCVERSEVSSKLSLQCTLLQKGRVIVRSCCKVLQSFIAMSGVACRRLWCVWLEIPYLLDQTPRLLFISSRNFVRLLFESGYYSRAAFIKLSGIGKIFCKCKGFEKSQFYKINRKGGVAADARESIRRDTAMLATATDTELEESDPFADVEEDEDELENELVLEDC